MVSSRAVAMCRVEDVMWCVWLQGPYIDLSCIEVMKNTDEALDGIVFFIQGLVF